MRKILFLSFLTGLFLVCTVSGQTLAASKRGRVMEIQSSAFHQGGLIPPQYTCTGKNISPPLSWKGIPEGTKSIAIITDDPDAPMGTWVHWVYYDIPDHVSGLPEHVLQGKKPSTGGTQGMNDSRNIGYDGPCPPSGIHRYYFKAYALDAMLNLSPGASKRELLNAMQGHILGESVLMGKYGK